MPDIKKVIIIGAGPAGLIAALRLHQANHIPNIAVYEIRSAPSTIGGAVGIPANGLRLLNRLGLRETIRARGGATPSIVLHSSHGDELGRYSITPPDEPSLEYTRIKRTELVDTLYKALEPCNIPVHFSKKLVHIEEHSSGITVTFSDGTTDTADLLLGCDGIHSAVRTTYVDPDTHPEYSGNATMSGLLPTSSLSTHDQFPLKGMHSTLTTDGMVACLPCKPDESELFWFFNRHVALPDAATIDSRDGWVEKRQHELSNNKSTISSVISDTKGPWGSFLRDIITATPSINFYPAYLLPLGRTWRKGSRCVLLGDAAHAMPPNASQGVSMALEDVFALSRALTLDADLGECWDRYDRVRRPRVESIYRWTMANASRVGKTGSWELRVKEMVVKWGLVFSNWFGTSADEKLSYDVDKAVL